MDKVSGEIYNLKKNFETDKEIQEIIKKEHFLFEKNSSMIGSGIFPKNVSGIYNPIFILRIILGE